jgi:transposase
MNQVALLEQKYRKLQAQHALLLERSARDAKQLNTQVKVQQLQLAGHQSLIENQQAQLAQRDHLIEQQQSEIAALQERLNILLAKRFQARSEQLKYIQGQLFDEAELEREITETREALEALRKPSRSGSAGSPGEKQKPKRQPLPAHLRRVEVIVDVSDEDKHAMGDEWVCIGHETSEQLAVRQREYYVKAIKRKKYVRKCAKPDEESDVGIRLAPPAPVLLPRSLADASLLADVLCSKFLDAMSFYRTEKRLSREGIEIGYSTLCDWPIQIYRQLKPFERLFYQALGQSPLWHLDETTLQVLDEPGRANQTISYLWGIRAGPPEQPIILFHYHSRRNFEALETWLRPALEDFQGVIVSDEHGTYDILARTYPRIQAHGGCLAHARRKFAEAVSGRKDTSDAHKALKLIALIYAQERKTTHLRGAQRIEARQQFVAPQMQSFKAFLDEITGRYLGKGAMNRAIGYARNNWHKFSAFLTHPDLPIDNNPMEQAIRPFTLGRKNWLFAGSPRGAEASAFIYSLIETAKANGLEPKRYLMELFERYPLALNDQQRSELLPWNFKFSG